MTSTIETWRKHTDHHADEDCSTSVESIDAGRKYSIVTRCDYVRCDAYAKRIPGPFPTEEEFLRTRAAQLHTLRRNGGHA